jgi:hypothetical protein
MIHGNPNPQGAPPQGEPNAPPTPVDEEAHFRLDDHQRQLDEIKKGDMKALVRAIGELVKAIRDLIATPKV